MNESKNHILQIDRLMKAAEVAEIFNISRAFAYRLMQRGNIRTVHIQGRRRVRQVDLNAYIEKNLSDSTLNK